MRASKKTPSSSALVGLVVALALVPARAHAYCRTSVCGEAASQICLPAGGGDCGIPLFWAPACFGFSVQEAASQQVDLATAEAIVDQAFSAWELANCNGAPPSINVSNLGPVACDQTEYNESGPNANVVVFRDEAWPYAGQGHTLALTTVTFSLDSGEIFDADLEINAASVQITTAEAPVQYDLLSIVTHEAGHMLGLAHSEDATSTMTVEYVPGDLQLRSLEIDDQAGICAAYPPGQIESPCDPTPRHGFGSECFNSAAPDDESCAIAPVNHDAPRRTAPALFVAAALLALTRRRRPQRHRAPQG